MGAKYPLLHSPKDKGDAKTNCGATVLTPEYTGVITAEFELTEIGEPRRWAGLSSGCCCSLGVGGVVGTCSFNVSPSCSGKKGHGSCSSTARGKLCIRKLVSESCMQL